MGYDTDSEIYGLQYGMNGIEYNSGMSGIESQMGEGEFTDDDYEDEDEF